MPGARDKGTQGLGCCFCGLALAGTAFTALFWGREVVATGALVGLFLLKGLLLLALPAGVGVVLWKYALDLLPREALLEEGEFHQYEDRLKGEYYPVEGQLNAWKRHWLPGPKVDAIERSVADVQAGYDRTGGQAHRRVQRRGALLGRGEQLVAAWASIEEAWSSGGAQLWQRALVGAFGTCEEDIEREIEEEAARLQESRAGLSGVSEALRGCGRQVAAMPPAPDTSSQDLAEAAPPPTELALAVKQAVSEVWHALRRLERLKHASEALFDWARGTLLPEVDAALDAGPASDGLRRAMQTAALRAVEPEGRRTAATRGRAYIWREVVLRA